MLRLAASWVWDFWFADDGERFHLFFLKASRALLDPNRRHSRAGIGHAVSADLTNWTELPDALVAADEPAFDDLATWTGSVVRADDGIWRMFYSGVNRASRGIVQRIGVAVSSDLTVWTRPQPGIVLEPDAAWYERLDRRAWPDEAWRDPWVMRDPEGNGWHMLMTARARDGRPDERGVVGHAWSPDLAEWQVLPPLSATESGFGHLEVLQYEEVGDRGVLVFSCLGSDLSRARQAAGEKGGVWAVNAPGPLGPFDVASAYRVTDESLYVGRLIRDRAGAWQLLAFDNTAPDGSWVGAISDPMPVGWIGDRLAVAPEFSGLDTHDTTQAPEGAGA